MHLIGQQSDQVTNNSRRAAELKADRVIYTSKEIQELGIPSRFPPPSPKPCKYCHRILYHEGIVFLGKVVVWHDMPQRCSCSKAQDFWKKYEAKQKNKKQQQEFDEKQRATNAKIEKLIGKSGIKKRFLSRTFEDFTVLEENKAAFETAKDYAKNFSKYAAEGKGLYFEGTYGTGKTFLAVAIALELIRKGTPVIFKTSIDMLADIKRAYDSNAQYDEYHVLDLYKKVDLLIIDDLGKEQCTEWSMPIIYAILNDRYEELRPTIITSNYNEDMLIRHLTPKNGDSSNIEAIISRLHECNDVVTMAWEDFRDGDAGA